MLPWIPPDSARVGFQKYPACKIPAQPTTHLDRAISAALLFCVAAERQGDRFGLISFSDKVNHLVKARAGSAHFNVCRDLAVSLTSQTVSPDFAEIAATLKQRIKRRSLFVFLTSLDDPVAAEDFVSAVELLSRQHLILAVMIAPLGVQPLFSEGPVEDPDEIYRQLGGHLSWEKLQNLQRVLARKGVQFLRRAESTTRTQAGQPLYGSEAATNAMIVDLQQFIERERSTWEELDKVLTRIENETDPAPDPRRSSTAPLFV